MRKRRSRKTRALLRVFLFMFLSLAAIAILVRRPAWYVDLTPDRSSHGSRSAADQALNDHVRDSSFFVDFSDWALPAILVVVAASGLRVWYILVKAER